MSDPRISVLVARQAERPSYQMLSGLGWASNRSRKSHASRKWPNSWTTASSSDFRRGRRFEILTLISIYWGGTVLWTTKWNDETQYPCNDLIFRWNFSNLSKMYQFSAVLYKTYWVWGAIKSILQCYSSGVAPLIAGVMPSRMRAMLQGRGVQLAVNSKLWLSIKHFKQWKFESLILGLVNQLFNHHQFLMF